MMSKLQLQLTDWRNVIRLVGVGLLVAAIATELRKPASLRTWHGMLASCVPYDLRSPTLPRVLSRIWAPDDPRVLVSTPFGVGWSINFARLVKSLIG
jgi:hypothetical protein